MKPFLVLIVVFIIATLGSRIFLSYWNIALAARLAMAAMLIFTAIGHFAFARGMSLMLPAFVPFKTMIIYVTGIIEFAAAVGLLVPSVQNVTAWLLILFFILVLPTNIYAAANNIDYQHPKLRGPGLSYLLFRIPLQILFIVWTFFAAIN